MSDKNEPIHDDAKKTEEPAEAKPAEGEDKKDLAKVRDAYKDRDVEASKTEHARKHAAMEPHAGGASDYIKAIVFGGLDGITTTFAIVTAAAGANESWKVVLIFGFANVLADAWSMGFGEFIGGNAERDHYITEREREEWEVDNNIEGEKQEMLEIYQERGFTEEEATTMVDIISRDKKRFVDIMMVEELGLLVDIDDKWEPLKQGVVMFLSFILFGIFPLLAYFGGKGQGPDYVFGISCALTGVGLMLLGAAKGYLTGLNIPITALIMLFQGVISGGLSFAVGILVTYSVNGEVSF